MNNDCNCNIRVLVSEGDPVGVNVGSVYNYNNLTNKPSINGVSLVGNKTTEDLHIDTGDKWELINSGSVQSGEYLRGALINKDTNNNSFLLKEFILYVWNTTIDGSSTAGTLEINDTNMLTGNIYFSPDQVLKFHAKYTGQGYASWNILNNVNMSDGNTMATRSQRIRDASLQVGLASSIKFTTASASVKMYFDYCLYGVRANES